MTKSIRVRVLAPVQRGAGTHMPGEVIEVSAEELAAWEGSVERVESKKEK